MTGGGAAGARVDVLQAGGVALHVQVRRATVTGGEVELTRRECELGEVLMRHAGWVLSRDQLRERVWGHGAEPASNVVDVYVGYLRRKLGPVSFATVRGIGYRFRR